MKRNMTDNTSEQNTKKVCTKQPFVCGTKVSTTIHDQSNLAYPICGTEKPVPNWKLSEKPITNLKKFNSTNLESFGEMMVREGFLHFQIIYENGEDSFNIKIDNIELTSLEPSISKLRNSLLALDITAFDICFSFAGILMSINIKIKLTDSKECKYVLHSGTQQSVATNGSAICGFGFASSSAQQTSAFGTQPTSAFGTQSTSAFGTQPTSAFGTQSTSAFGTKPTSAFGTQSTSAFGTQPTSAFGTQSTSAFGTQSTSAFGTKPTSAFGSHPTSAFGSHPTSAFGILPSSAPQTQPTSRTRDIGLRMSELGREPILAHGITHPRNYLREKFMTVSDFYTKSEN
jgi:hypothetical protein